LGAYTVTPTYTNYTYTVTISQTLRQAEGATPNTRW
jgi:hypothetical protein